MILAALECMWVAEEVEENLLQQQVKEPKIRIARRRTYASSLVEQIKEARE
jgi:hypothetical protein